MNSFWERFWAVVSSMRGRGLGVVIGIVFGLLYLIFGFWKVILFAGFVAIGYFVGSWWEGNDDWKELLDRILPRK